MHILWDMDGPLTQFEQRVHDALLELIPASDVIPTEQRNTFRLREQYPAKYGEVILDIMSTKGFYRELRVVPGTICAMNDQLAAGHEVNIVTSPLIESQHCAQEKFEWVREHMGQDWCKRLVITHDKTNVRGDVLIADKPEITGRGEREWRHVIYDMPYNRHLDHMPRLMKPSDWREVLLCLTPHLYRA